MCSNSLQVIFILYFCKQFFSSKQVKLQIQFLFQCLIWNLSSRQPKGSWTSLFSILSHKDPNYCCSWILLQWSICLQSIMWQLKLDYNYHRWGSFREARQPEVHTFQSLIHYHTTDCEPYSQNPRRLDSSEWLVLHHW